MAHQQYKPLDGGWGWVVVVASFLSVFLLASCITSFAILMEEFIEAFNLPRWQAGWIGSIQLALAFIHNIPAGVLVQQFGCRLVCFVGFLIASVGLGASYMAINYIMLFFTYGVVTGIGLGLAMLPIFLSVQLYFDKRRTLALGLALCGINLASFVTGPVMRFTIDNFGWRGATLLHSGAMLHGLIFSCAFRPLKPIVTAAQSSELMRDSNHSRRCCRCCNSCLELFDFALLKHRRFLLYIVANFFTNFSGMTFSQHLVSFGLVQGVNKQWAAFLPTVVGVCSASGRLIAGIFGDRKFINRRFLCGAFAMGSGAMVCFSFLGTDLISIGVLCGLFGLCTGTYSTLQFAILIDLVTVARIAQAQAFFSAFMGSSSLFSGPLSGIICIEQLSFPFYPRLCWERDDAGFLVDRTGDYNLPFFINGMMHVTGGALLLVVGQLHREHVTSTSAMNGHVTGNGDVTSGGERGEGPAENNNLLVVHRRKSPAERVELIITTV